MSDDVKQGKLKAVIEMTTDPATRLLAEIMLDDIKKNKKPPAKNQECGFTGAKKS